MMRHGKAWGPAVIRRVQIRELRKTGEYLVADTRAALVGLAQMGIVEIHTWNATARDTAHPDRIIFDLEPGEDLAWRKMQEGAELIHSLLEFRNRRRWLRRGCQTDSQCSAGRCRATNPDIDAADRRVLLTP